MSREKKTSSLVTLLIPWVAMCAATPAHSPSGLPKKVVALSVRVTQPSLLPRFESLLRDTDIQATFLVPAKAVLPSGTEERLKDEGHLLVHDDSKSSLLPPAGDKLVRSIHWDISADCPEEKKNEACIDKALDKMPKSNGATLTIPEMTERSLNFLKFLMAELDDQGYRLVRADLIPRVALGLWQLGGIPGEPAGGIQALPSGANEFSFAPPPSLDKKEGHKLWATWYRIHLAKDEGGKYPLLSGAGTPLGPKLSLKDWCNSALEGTVRILRKNGKPVTYNHTDLTRLLPSDQDKIPCDEQRDFKNLKGKDRKQLDRARFIVAKHPFGEGTDGLLVPYRTVAAQKGGEWYGNVIYIPKARGVKIVDGFGRKHKHDGYFFAGDEGVGIYGDHLDVFIGNTEGKKNPFSFIQSQSSERFTAYLVKDPSVVAAMKKMHRWKEKKTR